MQHLLMELPEGELLSLFFFHCILKIQKAKISHIIFQVIGRRFDDCIERRRSGRSTVAKGGKIVGGLLSGVSVVVYGNVD